MNSEHSDFNKLCKVLALTNSDKPGEALAAFQSAKRMLLSHGLSFEDIISNYFDDTGMPPQKQIAALKKKTASLKRELKDRKEAMDDLLNQIWELREGETSSAPAPEEPAPLETIQETYRSNLLS